MQTSIFLAKLIGPFALALGLAMLVNRTSFRTLANEFLANPALIFLSGIITLPAGLAIVLTHNVWTPNWRVIITILGWLAVVSGALRIIVPELAAAKSRRLIGHRLTPKIAAAFYLAVGAVLCYFGYFR